MTTMPATNSGSISSINFRTKFEKLVTDANRQALISAFEKFCSYDPCTNRARQILWSLTYNPDIALSTLIEKLGLNPDIISLDNISKLRDELRYQYEKLHGSYLLSQVPQHYAFEFDTLAKCAGSIATDAVVRQCLENCEYNINPFRALYLLESEQENNYFGGLRELGFNSNEAQFLKQYHTEICNLYKAMCEKHSPEDNSPNTVSTATSSFEDGDQSLPFDLEKVEADEITSTYKRVIAENVIMNRNIFTAFARGDDLNILPTIANLGFDLNEVMAKKEKIRDFIDATEEKESAETKLFNAHAHLNS